MVYSKVIGYTCMFSFHILFHYGLLQGIGVYYSIRSILYSENFLFIYFIYNTFYLLIPNS